MPIANCGFKTFNIQAQTYISIRSAMPEQFNSGEEMAATAIVAKSSTLANDKHGQAKRSYCTYNNFK